VADSTAHTLNHPLADPFATFLTVSPALHGVGKVGEAVAGVDRSVPRSLRQGDATVGMPPRSRNSLAAVAQQGYDAALQHALDTNPEGRLAGHAAKRIAGQIKEAERPRQAMRRAAADDLEHAGRELRRKLGTTVPLGNAKLAQAALRLTSEN